LTDIYLVIFPAKEKGGAKDKAATKQRQGKEERSAAIKRKETSEFDLIYTLHHKPSCQPTTIIIYDRLRKIKRKQSHPKMKIKMKRRR
jgi:hypothetical protein